MKEFETLEEDIYKNSFEEPKLKSMLDYAISGGKKIRPKILLLACNAVGGDSNDALPAAGSIELLHKFSLVHDDLVDKDELRRGKYAFYVKYGKDNALLMGDFVCSEALFNLRKLNNPQVVPECYSLFSKTFYKLCLGEILDIKQSKFMTQEEYLNMVYLKSGVVVESAAKIGALIGGGSWSEQQALASYGKNFAIAMQILNDIKDTMDVEKRKAQGKSSDIEEGKWNLLIIHAFESTLYKNKKELLEIMSKTNKTEKQIKHVQKIIKDAKSIDYSRLKASLYFKKAKENILSLKPTHAREVLLKIADIEVDKKYWKAK